MTQSHHHNKLKKKKTPLSQNAGHKSRLREELLKPQMLGGEGRGEAATADITVSLFALLSLLSTVPGAFLNKATTV